MERDMERDMANQKKVEEEEGEFWLMLCLL